MKKNIDVLQITLRLFYVLKLSILLYYVYEYFSGHAEAPPYWIWPVGWLGYFENTMPPIMTVFTGALVFATWSIFTPFKVVPKMLETIFFLLFFGIYYSHSNIDHGVHGVMLASFFICFINKASVNKFLLMRYAIGIFSFTYGLAGLWKVRFLFKMHDLSELAITLPYHIALDIVQSGESTKLAYSFLELGPFLNIFLWISVILLEFVGLFILWKQSWFKYWGVLIILLHLGTALVMNIVFWEAQLLSLLFLFYVWRLVPADLDCA